LFFALGGVALLSAFPHHRLYTARFRLIHETCAKRKPAPIKPASVPSHDEVGTSLDLIDRLVMKQRKTVGAPAPMQRLAVAARTLAHEVRTPLNALAIHLELLRNPATARMASRKIHQRARRQRRQVDRRARVATIPRQSPWKGKRRMCWRCWQQASK
jgi:signal transduction histidine kinase